MATSPQTRMKLPCVVNYTQYSRGPDNGTDVCVCFRPGREVIKSRCNIGLRNASISPCCWWHMRSSNDWTKWTCSDCVQPSNIVPHSSNCSGYCIDGSLLLRLEIRTPDAKDEPKNCTHMATVSTKPVCKTR